MGESMEKLNIEKEDKEKPIEEKLEELKDKEIKKMEKDKTLGPWKQIEVEHLIPEAQEVFQLLDEGKVDMTRAKFDEASIKIEKIKNPKKKYSNQHFMHWIDGKIDVAISKEQLEEERGKDN
jgi:hypothetical protein